MTNPNDPAFNTDTYIDGRPNEKELTQRCVGLSKREYFVAMAMQGLISNARITDEIAKAVGKDLRVFTRTVGNMAIAQADELISVLNKELKA